MGRITDINPTKLAIKAFIFGYIPNGLDVVLQGFIQDSTGANTYGLGVETTITSSDTADTLRAAVPAVVNQYCVDNGIPLPSSFEWLIPSASSFSPVVSFPTRALDTTYQAATRMFGFYTVQVVSNLSLTGGQLGSVVLEYADNSGFTTNLVTVSTLIGGNTGTLTIGLNTNDTSGGVVSGYIPSGKYYRLRSLDTTGAPVQTIIRSQEVTV